MGAGVATEWDWGLVWSAGVNCHVALRHMIMVVYTTSVRCYAFEENSHVTSCDLVVVGGVLRIAAL